MGGLSEVIKHIRQRMQDYAPEPLPEAYHEPRERAAVLLPILTCEKPELILTLRSGNLVAHGGEVAWPGGRHDKEDRDLRTTALRETHEEIGVPGHQIEVVGELRPFISKYGLLVTPFVGIIQHPCDLCPNPGELEAVFSVPIDYLLSDPRTTTNAIERHGERHDVPVYHYDGYKIWGLTAMILREFLNQCVGARIP